MLERCRAFLALPVLAVGALFSACGTSAEDIPETTNDSGTSANDASTSASDDASLQDGANTVDDDGSLSNTDASVADSAALTDGSTTVDSGPLAFCDASFAHLFCADFEDVDVNKGFSLVREEAMGTVTRDATLASGGTASAKTSVDAISAGGSNVYARSRTVVAGIGKRTISFDIYLAPTLDLPNATTLTLADTHFDGLATSRFLIALGKDRKVSVSLLQGDSFFVAGGAASAVGLPTGKWITLTLSADPTAAPVPYRFSYRVSGEAETVVKDSTSADLTVADKVGSKLRLEFGLSNYGTTIPASVVNFDNISVDAK